MAAGLRHSSSTAETGLVASSFPGTTRMWSGGRFRLGALAWHFQTERSSAATFARHLGHTSAGPDL
jgi:hypothetical protein